MFFSASDVGVESLQIFTQKHFPVTESGYSFKHLDLDGILTVKEFDYVDFTYPCSVCNEEVSEFQSQDGLCQLKRLVPEEVLYFQGTCGKCNHQLDFIRSSYYQNFSLYTRGGELVKERIVTEPLVDRLQRVGVSKRIAREIIDSVVQTVKADLASVNSSC
ncbi:MAG TPA: hypothetical protein EYQ14_01710 [Gammaproteobacteria bacterium]|nr:hypothetical protein [Gammaproteobacteria bacterium]HIL97430.1 hypothetical protein [Pseudomonadales bacterium]